MPEPHEPQSEGDGIKFFANEGEGDSFGFDQNILREMAENQMVMYGEHSVSKESFRFLTALEQELGREWLEEHLKTESEGVGRIRLNKSGDVFRFRLPGTMMTTLPELPSSLTHLDCSFSILTQLPKLPASLKFLDCSDSAIVTLPELPINLEEIICFRTPIARDPVKRANLEAKCKAKGIKLTI